MTYLFENAAAKTHPVEYAKKGNIVHATRIAIKGHKTIETISGKISSLSASIIRRHHKGVAIKCVLNLFIGLVSLVSSNSFILTLYTR